MYTQVIIGWFEDRGLVLSEIISGQKASAYMDFRKKKKIKFHDIPKHKLSKHFH